jgi:hypothetical protein
MANRNIDKIKLKRSNVSGKIPTLGQLELGEVALNTADAKLYTEYTGGASGSTDIREIGWNRVNITGDTMTGALYGPSISATTIDAGAYYSGGTSLLEIFLASNNNGNIYTTGTTLIGNTIYFDRTDTLSAYTADLSSLTTSGEFNLIEDTTPQLGGNLDINNFDINGLGNIDVTGNVISDVVQLRGGVGTQGEMSWNNDEETVQLIMDGTTLHIGQDTFVHVRNNTASIITKGTAVYATGTLGASGRITVAPMIADGTIPGRYFIGLAAENIGVSEDGQVCSYGKIKGLNTNAYTDGDVLWISPTVAGQLTTTEPTAPNLKIATAFVIHAATNGTVMVRAEQGTDLHTDQRVQVSGLANNDVLTWNNANQRWQNKAPKTTQQTTSTATLTINSDLQDLGVITAQAAALTIAAPTGTPIQGQKLIFRIKDNGTARGITWNAIFRIIGVTLPTTTVINKTTYVGCIYNSTDTKWDVVAVNREA